MDKDTTILLGVELAGLPDTERKFNQSVSRMEKRGKAAVGKGIEGAAEGASSQLKGVLMEVFGGSFAGNLAANFMGGIKNNFAKIKLDYKAWTSQRQLRKTVLSGDAGDLLFDPSGENTERVLNTLRSLKLGTIPSLIKTIFSDFSLAFKSILAALGGPVVAAAAAFAALIPVVWNAYKAFDALDDARTLVNKISSAAYGSVDVGLNNWIKQRAKDAGQSQIDLLQAAQDVIGRGYNQSQVIPLTQVISDMAAFTGKDMKRAGDIVLNAMEGNVDGLKKLGVKAVDAYDAALKIQKFASGAAEQTKGPLEDLKTSWAAFTEELGKLSTPMVDNLLKAVTGIIHLVNGVMSLVNVEIPLGGGLRFSPSKFLLQDQTNPLGIIGLPAPTPVSPSYAPSQLVHPDVVISPRTQGFTVMVNAIQKPNSGYSSLSTRSR